MKRAILSLFFLILTFLSVPAVPGVLPAARAADCTGAGDAACRYVTGGDAGACKACFDSCGSWSAVGCIGSGGTPNDFVQKIIEIGVGLGGGIAFLLILFAGFQRITSAGNPEKLHEAKELMTAAISGLLLIIFSIFLLKLIGVDILHIPGLG